jgi:signal transduction histidine kinase
VAPKNTGTVGLKGGETALFQENREIMSHEFRGLLNIIIGFTGLLLDEVPGKINDEQRRSLEDILRSSRRLLGLVEEVIDRFPPRP